MSSSRSSRKAAAATSHEANVCVSFELAVDAPEHTPHFHHCHRDGEKKRVFDSPTPEHYFHLQYQLLPAVGGGEEGGRGGVSKSDVVTFGVVSKVYTDKDTRVVRCWEEEEESDAVGSEEDGVEAETVPKKRAHFGWRHKHSFKVTRDLLLLLYDHTLEVRLWNTKGKLAPRARFDRPRAFRLPVPTEEEHGRPDRFPVVGQETERVRYKRRRRSRISKKTSSNLSSLSDESDVDLSASITEVSHSPIKPTASLNQIPAGDHLLVPHEDQSVPIVTNDDQSNRLVIDQSQQSETTGGDFCTPLGDHEKTTDMPQYSCSTPLPFLVCDSDMSRSKLRRLEAEAAERARLEREGVVVLRLKMADLFAKRDSISTNMDGPIDNIRAFEVSVSLDSPLMSDSLRRDLNPTVFTVNHATNLPTQHLQEQTERCDPVYVKYQFHTLPEHSTTGCDRSHDVTCQSHDVTWDDSHVILLGTIDRELLAEYLRGPPLVMEVHDRDHCLGREQKESTFGAEQRDELLGTHAFGAGGRVSEIVRCHIRPWDPFGVARFNLVDLLTGQQMIQLTTPITAGPRAPPSREDCRIGPHGRELPPPLPPGDYLNSYLTITVELSHPLPPPFITPHTITAGTTSLEEHSTTTCPFTRLIYVTSTDEAGQILIHRILDCVNGINTVALGLEELPRDMLVTALSTYKLTKQQMEGGGCDVVTGLQVRDSKVSVLVMEGLRRGAIPRMWARLPRHPTQDPGLVKVFYNSGYCFSQRMYGSLDVDLPLIFLPHSLTTLTKLPPLYIKGNVTPAALRGLLCLSEISSTSSGGGMAELVRNDLFPSVYEISAVALQFGALPGTSGPVGDSPEQQYNSDHPDSRTLIPAVCEGEGVKRERKLKMPLDMQNADYERLLGDKKGQPPVDYINKNIGLTHTLSEHSASLSANRQRRKARIRSKTDPQTVHLYSSQTLNSAVLAKARKRAELGYDHTHQLYTYCQDYHSMTFEPVDTENEKRAQRLAERQRWCTSEGFVYPGVPHLRESNAHPLQPHPGRVEELTEPFTDGLLHANTTKPTVQRLRFRWDQRREDFNRYYHLPSEFGPSLPPSIHLAGQQRAREVSYWEQLAAREWEKKVVVDDTRFHTHRKGVCAELQEKASLHNGRLEDILKDPPVKYNLRQKGLCLKPIPPLDVVRNGGSVDQGGELEGERYDGGGLQPGPNEKGSLKRDANVVPLYHKRAHSHSNGGWRVGHSHHFRLYYHTHSPISKRIILPLSPSEKHPPLFPNTPTPLTQHTTTRNTCT